MKDKDETGKELIDHRVQAIEKLNEIQDKYTLFLEQKKSRMDDEWGKWSHNFNRELRPLCEIKENNVGLRYKYVFLYWSNISNLLELHYRFPAPFLKKKKKQEYVSILNAFKKVIEAWDITGVQDPGDFKRMLTLTTALKKSPNRKFKKK